jgi:exodeoxyribonuclease VII small subunit
MTKTNQENFGGQLEELEAITSWFESDQVDLDEGITKFERGMELVTSLRKRLDDVENRVEKVKAKFEAPIVTDTVDEPELPPLNSADDHPELFS